MEVTSLRWDAITQTPASPVLLQPSRDHSNVALSTLKGRNLERVSHSNGYHRGGRRKMIAIAIFLQVVQHLETNNQ